MTFRDTPWPEGTPCWVDLMVPDAAKAKRFYGELFGWEYATAGDPDNPYELAMLAGRRVAGIGENTVNPDVPPAWTTYIAVSDTDAVAAKVERAGGKVLMPPMEIPTAGTLAVFADPTGAAFGVWQAGENTGAQVANVAGALTWNEVMTHDYEAATRFYTEVFGYGLDDMSNDQFRYSTLKVGEQVVGGLGGLPAEASDVPPHWQVYFAVADTDRAAQRIGQLGGSIRGELFDSPYGRVAEVADNQGVAFCVISAPPQG